MTGNLDRIAERYWFSPSRSGLWVPLLGTIVSSSVTGQDVQLASRQLASLWGLATADAERFSSDEAALGLLHVQALLYTIWETAGPGAFLSDTAMRRALRIDDSPPAAEAKAVFLEALPRYIELRLPDRTR